MSDLQRLRAVCCPDCVDGDSCGDCQAIHDAAGEIERLRAERDELLSDIQLMASPHESVGHIVLEYRRDRDTARALAEQFQHELDTVNRLANLDQQQLIEARALITAVAQSGVSWTTRGYVVAQIDRATWDAVRRIGGAQ